MNEPRGGTLSYEYGAERLEYRLMEGLCRSGEIVAYLEVLASEAENEGILVVVVLDNAPCHRGEAVRERRDGWEARGLKLYHLPAYCHTWTLRRARGVGSRAS